MRALSPESPWEIGGICVKRQWRSLSPLLAPAAALPQAKSGKAAFYEQLNLFGEAFERIRHDAVEPVADGKLVRPRSPACWPASTRIRST